MKLGNVVVIDDDPFVRSSLTAGLKSFGVVVQSSGENFASVIDVVTKSEIDVAIVDLDLGPGPSGIDICKSLRKAKPKIGLVILTSYTDPKYADPHMQNLPKGTRFLSKTNLTDYQILLNEILIAKIKPLSSISNKFSKNPLTQTQIEVLKMVAEGLSTTEIAQRRGVTPKAIESIISKIHLLLGVEKTSRFNQRVQLAREYFKLSGKKPPGA